MTDPRVYLAWWISMTILSFHFRTIPGLLGLNCMIGVVWVLSRKGWPYVKTLLGFAPFLLFLVMIRLNRPQEAAVSLLQMLGMLTSGALVISLGPSVFVNALRNLRHRRMESMEIPVELVSSMLGTSMMTVPLVRDEIKRLQELQRARGIDDTGLVKKAGNGIRLAVPLFERILDRNKYLSLSSEIQGYDPFGKRSIYTRLILSKKDKVFLVVILFLTVVAMAFRV